MSITKGFIKKFYFVAQMLLLAVSFKTHKYTIHFFEIHFLAKF